MSLSWSVRNCNQIMKYFTNLRLEAAQRQSEHEILYKVVVRRTGAAIRSRSTPQNYSAKRRNSNQMMIYSTNRSAKHQKSNRIKKYSAKSQRETRNSNQFTKYSRSQREVPQQ